jgi:hypothetical protein
MGRGQRSAWPLYAGTAAASDPADAPRIAISPDRLALLQAIVRRRRRGGAPFRLGKAHRRPRARRASAAGQAHRLRRNPLLEPGKKAQPAARRDLFNIEALGYAYAVTGNREYGGKAREFILAWTRTYAVEGNPINETEFVRLMRGYDLARGLFSPLERAEAERWLLRMAEQERNAVRPGTTSAENNHMSHRLKIIGHVGYLLADEGLRRWTNGGISAARRPQSQS